MRSGDLAGFRRSFRILLGAQGLSADELTAGIGELAPLLVLGPGGVFAHLALAAGALVEWGGSPAALAAHAPSCALRVMAYRVAFTHLWPQAGGGIPEPDPDQPPAMDDLIELFTAAASRMNLPEEKAAHIAYSWFDAPRWVNLMITCLGRREFRDATGQLPLLGEAGRAIAGTVPRAHWLDGLSAVRTTSPS